MKRYIIIAVLVCCSMVTLNGGMNSIRDFQHDDRTILCDMLRGKDELVGAESTQLLNMPNGDILEVSFTFEERVDLMLTRFRAVKVYTKDSRPIAFIVYDTQGYQAPYIDATKKRDSLDFKNMQLVKHAHICLLIVDSKYYHQGIGTALLKEALKDMKKHGVKVVMLDTDVNNNAARSLYEKNGFSLAVPVRSSTICFYRMALDPKLQPC